MPPQCLFGLVPKVFDAVDMVVAFSEQYGMIDPVVTKFHYIDNLLRLYFIRQP